MHIDQTKLTDNVVKNLSRENGNMAMENFMVSQQEAKGFFASKIDNVSKSGSVRMTYATYTKPAFEDDKQDFVEQLSHNMDMSAENRKNQMVVVANTTTPEDYKKMQEDGFSFSESSSNTIITETDKIKAVLARAGVDISIYGDSLSKEQLEEITGSAAVATQIEAKLAENDIPTTVENMQDAKLAYDKAISIGLVTDDAKAYLIKNNLSPSIDNIYKAQYSSANMTGGYQQDVPMTEEQLDELTSQIKQFVEEAGFSSNTENMNYGKWLIRNGIELNQANLQYLSQLNGLSISAADTDMILDSISQAISEGTRPIDAMLLPGYSISDLAEEAYNVVIATKDEDLQYVVDNSLELNIKNLKYAANVREHKIELTVRRETSVIEAKLDAVTARRTLEETRLTMTVQANYSLLKRGISIDTKPLEALVEDLKNIEKQYYADLLSENGVEASEENVSVFKSTVSLVEEIKWQPAYALSISSAQEGLQVLHSNGEKVKASFEAANERYEIMMTSPRSDMGDSIFKAFRNVDDILEDIGFERTAENQKAVRILAYNSIEINVSTVNQIKAADEQVQRAFKNMTPAVTLEMIKKRINPLDMSISELNTVAEEIKGEAGESTEKFSKFLWKLEKNNEITEKERSSYIGIYRLIAQVEKADDAAIGALLNQGADLTLRNMLSAVRTSHKHNMDYSVDDDFAGVDSIANGTRIDEQIMASYYRNCASDVLDIITPDNMKAVMDQDIEEMTPEQLRDKLQEIDAEADAKRQEEIQKQELEFAKEQISEIDEASNASQDIYRILDRYDIQNSLINVIAVNRMVKNPNQVFNTIFNEANLSEDDINRIRRIKAEIFERFSEAVKAPEELADAQETLAEVAAHAMDNMIIEDRHASTIDIREMKLASKQLRIAAKMAKEESYVIPVETGDSTTGVSLKIIRGEEEKGFVDIFFNTDSMGKVAASFEAKETSISGIIATSDEETRTLLADNLQGIVASINESNIDIRVAYIKDVSSEQFEISSLHKEAKINASISEKASIREEEKNPVQTRRLYNIAESFIKTIQELNNVF